jgi:hypothetical protein
MASQVAVVSNDASRRQPQLDRLKPDRADNPVAGDGRFCTTVDTPKSVTNFPATI